MIQNGGGDAQGSERGLEYDTLSGKFAEFIEAEVLPQVETHYAREAHAQSDGRAAMGCSSGAAAAFTMAWFHPEWYHRVISYSGTFVNQQWPFNPRHAGRRVGLSRDADSEAPSQAHPHLDAGGRPGPLQPERHARRHARLGRGQSPHGRGAEERATTTSTCSRWTPRHCDRRVREQTLPEALEWVWRGYRR